MLYTVPMDNKYDSKISDMFLRVAARFSDIDKNAECEIEDENYVNAEMHIVKIVKENEGIHVTGIAEILGVTKGAVSQVANRLEKRGIIWKEKDDSNQSRLVLTLTEKGENLYQVHEDFHNELNDMINDTLENATEENKIFLQNFLDAVEAKILKIHIK